MSKTTMTPETVEAAVDYAMERLEDGTAPSQLGVEVWDAGYLNEYADVDIVLAAVDARRRQAYRADRARFHPRRRALMLLGAGLSGIVWKVVVAGVLLIASQVLYDRVGWPLGLPVQLFAFGSLLWAVVALFILLAGSFNVWRYPYSAWEEYQEYKRAHPDA